MKGIIIPMNSTELYKNYDVNKRNQLFNQVQPNKRYTAEEFNTLIDVFTDVQKCNPDEGDRKRLADMLDVVIEKNLEQNNKTLEEIRAKIAEEKEKTFNYAADTEFTQIKAQADSLALRFLRLSDAEKSTFIKRAETDRTHALAVLSLPPELVKLNSVQSGKIISTSKTMAEKTFERAQAERIEQLDKIESKHILNAFHMNHIVKLYRQKTPSAYFQNT